MSSSGRRISQVMRQIASNQNAPAGSGFGLPSPIARGLGRAGEISSMNSSLPNQSGFGQMLASLQLLRNMPNINVGELSSLVGQSQDLPLRGDLSEPDLSEFDTDDIDEDDDSDPEPDPE
ncbi:hypothetical protein [Glaciecola sp. MF2-115]|uniref:hypothetical protein n=1 Tax=Glaciecola sp. MF2-115 TaxID=3384827 RepID=UPI0039A3B8B0